MKVLRNRYELESKIKDGGMARIYKAFDHFTRKDVAIKENILSKDEFANSKIIQRLQREFYFLSKIDHPNIVKGVDLFELKNRYLLVMEYVEGKTLTEFIRESSQSISLKEQLEICIQICDAVSTLNKSGVIHRDIKPSNIMLTTEAKIPKLLDLGIAKSTQDDLPKLTEPGKILGTQAYMSPEQIRGESSDKSDTFSLGVLFYQFFSWQEKSPFSEGNSVSTIYKITYENIPKLRDIIDDKSSAYQNLSDILEKTLSKQPEDRISTDELKRMLQKQKSKKSKKPSTRIERVTKTENRKKSAKDRNKKLSEDASKMGKIYGFMLFTLLIFVIALICYYFFETRS